MVDERDVFETNVNTDGRKQYDWESKYPECAQKEMKKEAIYIAIILIIAFSLLIFIVGGLIDKVGNLIGLEAKKTASLEGVIIYFFSGLLGGTILDLSISIELYRGAIGLRTENIGDFSRHGFLRALLLL